jgi:hypothetical protein
LTEDLPIFHPENAKAQIRKPETSIKPVKMSGEKQNKPAKIMPDDLLAISNSITRKEIQQDVIVQFNEKSVRRK